jgi:hypothetical protein
MNLPELHNLLESRISSGRKGLGNIFVFASGDQGELGDNTNYDSNFYSIINFF